MDVINKLSTMSNHVTDSKEEFSAEHVINSQGLKNILTARDVINENSFTGKQTTHDNGTRSEIVYIMTMSYGP